MKINVSTIYLYLPAEMQKWTKVDAFFVYFIFFSIFSLIPPSTCYYVITPFLQNTPFYQRLCVFFTFLTPFLHFFAPFHTFSRPYNRERSIQSPNHHDSKPLSRADARTHPTPAHFFYLFLVLTCEKDSSVSEKA